jgi:hypothetical protein
MILGMGREMGWFSVMWVPYLFNYSDEVSLLKENSRGAYIV